MSATDREDDDCVFLSIKLEEANRTLTSDVANLANEKEELNCKLKEALEGMPHTFKIFYI